MILSDSDHFPGDSGDQLNSQPEGRDGLADVITGAVLWRGQYEKNPGSCLVHTSNGPVFGEEALQIVNRREREARQALRQTDPAHTLVLLEALGA